MNCRRQALQFCLDAAVVVVIQICNEFQFEVFHGAELLQIQQFTFEQPEEIFCWTIWARNEIQASAKSAFLMSSTAGG